MRDSGLLLFPHPTHVNSTGITMKKALLQLSEAPVPLLQIICALFYQCDPFMRTDLVISGKGVGYSFIVIMKAAPPKSRAAIVRAQGCASTVITWHRCLVNLGLAPL